jgi:hypothetical protein
MLRERLSPLFAQEMTWEAFLQYDTRKRAQLGPYAETFARISLMRKRPHIITGLRRVGLMGVYS